jgi:hypothetical protein
MSMVLSWYSFPIPQRPSMKDYHPISLIHIVGKLISKVLDNKLGPKLVDLVHPSQSAFIKNKFIQDNFRFVHASTKLLHARKHPSLLIKEDITRAFDSVAWSFLIEVLQHMGFNQTWIN